MRSLRHKEILSAAASNCWQKIFFLSNKFCRRKVFAYHFWMASERRVKTAKMLLFLALIYHGKWIIRQVDLMLIHTTFFFVLTFSLYLCEQNRLNMLNILMNVINTTMSVVFVQLVFFCCCRFFSFLIAGNFLVFN